ncbi:MAG: radical SAM/Cys-rich domain protein [Gammaproteobacteria bacterium]|jgi:radical SAM/Cys-rich protein|nr:radical SAM/Cys-rich domain protein [Gammaproteobacteria bacterium]MBT5221625.1 radical SAM/Cys-rich domain protein [Gammaproteobacteria bacterium]MBT5826060.1 radical SAM/Cys-rich domain protein [Gammaproteobacteria bacterium]MBT6419860.1 radical SAM/Cys-rich domain protein [Gammaproteobacteria bacterium]MBT6577216.1 radical SAM/Cys-rich domain protein [Gammaproteobacteria bacterium]
MRDVKPLLLNSDFPPIHRGKLKTLQMNLGYLCNLSCTHCHVNAGPNRTELMARETMQIALQFAAKHQLEFLDLTGGSPEMNPDFRWLVQAARDQGLHVMDRCNPTILVEPGYEDMAEFLAAQQVEVIASLPCYMEDNVDAQRGKGVFNASIKALQKLNQLGYGQAGGDLILNLVFNPQGMALPPPQLQLEESYRTFLSEHFDLQFNQLFTITNMPIQRFGAVLQAKGQFDEYMTLLKQSYQAQNLEQLMCKSLLSVDWQGYVYDCDFNQMLDMPLAGKRTHLSKLLNHMPDELPITVAEHCYGCTAGQGSSCTGVLTN